MCWKWWTHCRRNYLLRRKALLLLTVIGSLLSITLLIQQKREKTYFDSSHEMKSKIAGGGNVQLDWSHVPSNGRAPKQVDDEKTSNNIPKKKDINHTSSNSVSILTKKDAHVDILPSISGPDSLHLLQNILTWQNKIQKIHNSEKFSSLSDNSLVLVVQVHKRERYLKQLLESLKVARGIENVLLVISHDYYYDEMNEIVRSIEFCPVLQIFYPFSLQVMPSTYPGASPGDCPRNIKKAEAIRKNCTNALYPDMYGHYREAIVTAIKHHWWWKINMVFDHLNATKNYSGHVFFLEEDHYVAPDFVEVAKQLIELKKKQKTPVDFVNLGMYTKYKSLNNRVSIGTWNAGKNNMGFGMDRMTWNLIRDCSEYFCSYDDYNWDWSLNQLGKACPAINRHLKVIVLRTPRIFHIGTCGTHHHKSCNEMHQASQVQASLAAHKSNLFPSSLVLDNSNYPPATRKKSKPYGGWGDIRDHKLCKKFTRRDTPIGDGGMAVT